MAIAGAVTSFFICVVVLMYSAMVWRSLDQYFKEEFKKHLAQDKTYQKLHKDKFGIVEEQAKSIKESVDSVKFDEGILKGQKAGCRREKMPADKYKSLEEDEEDYLDEGEVCPFTPPLSVNKDGGG